MNITLVVLCTVFFILCLILSAGFFSLRRKNSELAASRNEALARSLSLESQLNETRSRAESLAESEMQLQEQIRTLIARHTEAQVRLETLQAKAESDRQELEKLQASFRAEFRNLANDILEEKSKQFKQTSRESMEALLKPFGDSITEFKNRVETIYSDENQQRGALKNEIRNLLDLNRRITEETTNVFLESACFDPVFVRKTARRHGLSTDASFRYERGTDPNIVIYALKRAAMLIQEVGGGRITSDIIDIYPKPVEDFEVKLQYAHVDRLIGKALPHETIKKILTALEIKIVEENEESLLLHVPPYRVDVKREADVIEDILRIYGFNNIEVPASVRSTLSYVEKPDDFRMKNLVSDLLTANGFHEIMNNSLTKAAYYEQMDAYQAEESVKLLNPLSSDLNVLRQSLLFGGLESIARNVNHKRPDLRLYEFGKAYSFHQKEVENHLKQYHEEDRLALFITGEKSPASWNNKAARSDFFTLKGYVEMILARLGIQAEYLNVEETDTDICREGLTYTRNGKHLVSFGIVSRKALKLAEVEQEVYYAEFSWENLLRAVKEQKITFRPLPKFPAVKRDLALLLDQKTTFKEVRDIAMRTEKGLLKSVTLFDVYEGEKLGEGKKSYAVSFLLQNEEGTLTDKQIDKIMNKLMGAYKHLLNAEIR